jgi:hypothetical protein
MTIQPLKGGGNLSSGGTVQGLTKGLPASEKLALERALLKLSGQYL